MFKRFNPKSKSTTITLAAMATLVLAGCSSNDDDDNSVIPAEDQAALSLSFTALDDLGEDFVYEGWLLVNGAPVSTGRFTSNTADQQVASAADVDAATKYILTIEPAVGDDPAPADTHVLAGDILNLAATLTISDSAAIGTDFTNSTGSFIIATPTEGPDTFTQGIWWLATPGPVAGLTLPTLPAGWVYEGWVAGPDGPISTGTFTSADGADSDGAGPTAGPLPAPPFPGQDFIDPALVVVGLNAVISVEPSPDNSPAPFGIKPLIDSPIENVGDGGTQPMANVIADNQPSGTLTIVMP